MRHVLLTVDDGVATVTLNRPEALNAIHQAMRAEIVAAWERIREDDAIRVGVVTGAGRAFCAGFDIKEAVARFESGGPLTRTGRASLADPFLPYTITKPMIAAVNGAAAGGGLGLALACDILIASPEGFFLAPFAGRGILNPVFVGLIARKAPFGSGAAWMNYSSERIGAQAALAMGLVNEVVPGDALLDRARAMAALIAANPPDALAAVKRQLQRVLEGGGLD
jgi:enoyl-CoA hydratase/carnithine racemase